MPSNFAARTSNLTTLLILHAIPICFSANMVVGRALRESVEPATLAFYRWFFASLILLVFSSRLLWQHRAQLWRAIDLLLILGFLGMVICGALFYIGLQQTTAVNGALIYMASPAIIILIEVLFYGLRLGMSKTLGIMAAMFGVGVVLLIDSGINASGFEWRTGDVYCVIASSCWAIYSLILRSKRLAGLPVLVVFTAIALAGVLMLFPLYLWENGPTATLSYSGDTWIALGVVSTIASVFAFGFYQKGVSLVGAATTSLYLYLLPVYAVLQAYIFLDESLSYFHVIGFIFIAVGLYFATKTKEKPA